ncbi:MAG: iron-containing alcohol dehydrogenase [Erysipelotrichaceae bacterium]|nr:iron-containing alcohol dehydrogenase [Erysipelotrichaceae bacterium]
MTTKTFFCPTEIIDGPGVVNTLPQITADYGKKAMIVVDPFFLDSPLLKRIEELLAGYEIRVFGKVTPNPRDNEINEGAAICRDFGADFIIAIGGGSAIDSAKAINIVSTNGGQCWDYVRVAGKEIRPITEKLLPLIAIPTTSGTGSECTRYSVVTNGITHAKSTIKTDLNFPTKALVDPELTVSVPRKTTALTAIDAFAHCFESYIGPKANEFSEMFSLKGMELFIKSVRKAIENGSDTEARNDLSMCSTLGGLAITHSATTLPHGIGQALSGVTDAPHGGSIAVCMPQVIEWTLPYGQQRFAKVACMFDESLKALPEEQQAAALPKILKELFSEIIGEKLTMASYGLTEDKIEAVADMTLSSYGGDVSRHPRVADRDELIKIIRSCL